MRAHLFMVSCVLPVTNNSTFQTIVSVGLVYGHALAYIKERALSANTQQGVCSTMNRNFKQYLELYSLSTLICNDMFLKKKGNFLPSTSFLKIDIIPKLAEKVFRESVSVSRALVVDLSPEDTADLKVCKIPQVVTELSGYS